MHNINSLHAYRDLPSAFDNGIVNELFSRWARPRIKLFVSTDFRFSQSSCKLTKHINKEFKLRTTGLATDIKHQRPSSICEGDTRGMIPKNLLKYVGELRVNENLCREMQK